MTRVRVKVEQPISEKRMYICAVTGEGRKFIVSSYYDNYDYDEKGTRTSTVNITGK